MNICIYGASSNIIDKSYIDAVEVLGEKLGNRGHGLVFGAGAEGLMGASARGMKKAGGYIVGIAPSFFNVDGVIYEECDELIRTETMRERKQIMEDNADAFIVVPGGIGTYEEFFEILTSKQLCRHNKPIAIYNVLGFYDEIDSAMRSAIKKGFIKELSRKIG